MYSIEVTYWSQWFKIETENILPTANPAETAFQSTDPKADDAGLAIATFLLMRSEEGRLRP